VFFVIAKNLALACRWLRLPGLILLRQGAFYFLKVLDSVTREGNRFSGGLYSRNNVVSLLLKRIRIGSEGLFFASEIAISDVKRPKR
jgi:hypothetical protein